MPKRVATPTYEQDEYCYLTVVQPYPKNCNWIVQADRVNFALWISCIIGKDNLISIYHRPVSNSTAIIEVIKGSEKGILGEHKWGEFLKHPDQDDCNTSSKVFYCTYKTPRAAERNGWKRISVEDEWFILTLQGQAPQPFQPSNNGRIRHPYPPTCWCEPPFVDATQINLCHTLPVAQFQDRPVVKRQEVPGSDPWNERKGGPKTHTSKKTPVPNNTNTKPNVAQPKPTRPGPPVSAWGNAAQLFNPPSSSVRSGSIAAPPGLSAPVPPPPSIGAPPGLSLKPKKPKSHYSNMHSSSSPASAALSIDDDFDRLTFTTAQEDGAGDPWDGCSHKSSLFAKDEDTTSAGTFYGDEEVPSLAGTVFDGEDSKPAAGNLWANHSDDTKKTDEIICPEHGATCPKKMCKVYSTMLRESTRKNAPQSSGGPWNVRQADAEKNNQSKKKNRKRGKKNGNDNQGNQNGTVGDSSSLVTPASPTSASGSGDGFKAVTTKKTRRNNNAMWEDSDDEDFGSTDVF